MHFNPAILGLQANFRLRNKRIEQYEITATLSKAVYEVKIWQDVSRWTIQKAENKKVIKSEPHKKS